MQAYGARRAAVDAKPAVFFEQAVRSPRQEVKLIRLRVEVDKVVVAVAGVAVPKTEQPLELLKLVECHLVDQIPNGRLIIMLVCLQLGDLQEVGAAGADVHAVDGE